MVKKIVEYCSTSTREIDKEAELLVLRARTGLLLDQPFFGSLLMRMGMEQKKQRFPMSTDGKTVWYDPDKIKEWTIKQIKGVLAHEIWHVASLDWARIEERDPWKWNVAVDYIVNNHVKKVPGLDLPDGVLYDASTAKYYVEELYSMLPDNKKGDQGQPSSGSGPGSIPMPPNPGDQGDPDADSWNVGNVEAPKHKDGTPLSPEEMAQMQQETIINVAAAAQTAKNCGNLPAGAERLVEQLTEPKITWREVMSRFFSENCRNDYTWKRPNRRFLPMGFYIPDLYNDDFDAEGIILFDTSGSIGKSEINFGASEVCGCLSIFSTAKEIPCVYVDVAVAGYEMLNTADTPCDLHPKGGGGTCFKPGFKWAEEQGLEPSWALYFTDGYCNSFPEDPGYPVLWVLTEDSKRDFNPPFGEVIKIDFKEEMRGAVL